MSYGIDPVMLLNCGAIQVHTVTSNKQLFYAGEQSRWTVSQSYTAQL